MTKLTSNIVIKMNDNYILDIYFKTNNEEGSGEGKIKSKKEIM